MVLVLWVEKADGYLICDRDFDIYLVHQGYAHQITSLSYSQR